MKKWFKNASKCEFVCFPIHISSFAIKQSEHCLSSGLLRQRNNRYSFIFLSFHRELELKRCCQPISFCAQEQPLQLCQFIGTVLLYGLVGSLCEEKEEVKFQSRAKLQLHPPPASHLVAMPCLCTISHIYR